MDSDDRAKLISHIALLSTDADTTNADANHQSRLFLPTSEHRLALRPDVVVIQGTRGAGKTAFFKLVNQLGSEVPTFFQDPAIPDAQWVEGFSEYPPHPPTPALDSFVGALDPTRDAKLRAFWIVHLLACLVKAEVPGAAMPPEVQVARESSPDEISGWIDVAEQKIGFAGGCVGCGRRET